MILAADTSTESMGVALWDNNQLVAETVLRTGLKHAVTFMPAVENILNRANIDIQAIDAFACTTGPGSFTGIRIGISAVKGMAFAAQKPAFGVSTLEVLAAGSACIAPGIIICPMLDARNDRIYAAAWTQGRSVIDEANWQAEEFLSAVRKVCSQQGNIAAVYLIGSGKKTILRNSLLPEDIPVQLVQPSLDYPRPSVAAAITEQKITAGETGDPDRMQPSYLGLSQAERMTGKNRHAKT